MEKITYPFHVKHGGKHYAPGEPIRVEDAQAYVKQGAVLLTEEKKQGRPKKKE